MTEIVPVILQNCKKADRCSQENQPICSFLGEFEEWWVVLLKPPVMKRSVIARGDPNPNQFFLLNPDKNGNSG